MTSLSLMTAANVNAEDQQQGLERITVTAQKRVQSIQEIPTSITALSGENLDEQEVGDLLDLSESMPNVHITETSRSKRVFMRGIGSGTNSGFEQSVAIFQDGIYFGRGHQAKFPLLDIERVEIIKGPQAVMFGKNATAGALSLTTRKPQTGEDGISGKIDMSYGTDAQQNLSAALNLPVNDELAFRIAAFGHSEDGYLKNQVRDQDEVASEASGFRLSALWEPSENLSLLVQLENGQFEIKKGVRY